MRSFTVDEFLKNNGVLFHQKKLQLPETVVLRFSSNYLMSTITETTK